MILRVEVRLQPPDRRRRDMSASNKIRANVDDSRGFCHPREAEDVTEVNLFRRRHQTAIAARRLAVVDRGIDLNLLHIARERESTLDIAARIPQHFPPNIVGEPRSHVVEVARGPVGRELAHEKIPWRISAIVGHGDPHGARILGRSLGHIDERRRGGFGSPLRRSARLRGTRDDNDGERDQRDDREDTQHRERGCGEQGSGYEGRGRAAEVR